MATASSAGFDGVMLILRTIPLQAERLVRAREAGSEAYLIPSVEAKGWRSSLRREEWMEAPRAVPLQRWATQQEVERRRTCVSSPSSLFQRLRRERMSR